jgi:hypothetical protein
VDAATPRIYVNGLEDCGSLREPVSSTNLKLLRELPLPPQPRPAPEIPDELFIADLDKAIRGGSTASAAARWLGVPRKTWRNWLARKGEPYEGMRATIKRAVGALEVRLHNDIARRNPMATLHRIHPQIASPDYQRFIARMAKKQPWEKLGLSLAQEMFCRELVTDPEENATAAVRRVGLWKATDEGAVVNIGSRMLKKKSVQLRLAQLRAQALQMYERKNRTKITRERVLEKIASIALSDMRDVVIIDEHGMTVKRTDEWSDQAAEAVQSVQNTSEGVKITLHNPVPALETLAEFTGLKKAAEREGFGGVVQIQRAVVLLPDNGRGALPLIEMNGPNETTNIEQPRPGVVVDLPPRDPDPNPPPVHDSGSFTEREQSDEPEQPNAEEPNDLERELGL